MKYLQISFDITPYSEAAADVLAALLGDMGCEAFVERAGGLEAYIQDPPLTVDRKPLTVDRRPLTENNENLSNSLKALVAEFPFPDVVLSYSIAPAPDEDWNATWEAEGFEPINIDDRILIYDDRHGEPYVTPATNPLRITIHPQQAFGTGSHQTTRMVLRRLLDTPLTDKTVIDAGCGTGILGIAAARLGARDIVAYDIDEWSVNNTRENFGLNTPHHAQVHVLLGDSSVLESIGQADIVLANIHRNIIMADMSTFVDHLTQGGRLIISGFLTDDVQPLVAKAKTLGLTLAAHDSDAEWQCLCLVRE